MGINELAMRAGIKASTIMSIIDGSTAARMTTIKKLCDGLDITISDFFDTEEFKNLEQEIK